MYGASPSLHTHPDPVESLAYCAIGARRFSPGMKGAEDGIQQYSRED